MRRDLASVDTGSFRAIAFVMDGRLVMTFSGGANTGSMPPLHKGLKMLHEEASRMKLAEVTIDLRELDAMTPRCFKSFVTFISEVGKQRAPYRVRFLRNPTRRWQKESLRALACFAPDLVTIAG